MRDTIYALATAPGRAAIAVVRISGPASDDVLKALAGRRLKARHATFVRLTHPSSNNVLDHALVLWLPGPGSYTGEDQVELHLHGGRAVVDGVFDALSALSLRLAEPGEFTRRAFENGRLELSEAEAVSDLIDAETDWQRRQALAQLNGGLTARNEQWRIELLEVAARLEAVIDFPDEDLPGGLADQARMRLSALHDSLCEAATDQRGERIRAGFRIALIGAPNVGKSSLLNALTGQDVAIVTNIAGTTRDVLEVSLVLDGYKVTVADTAGLCKTTNVIEQEGIRRARAWADGAALRLLVVDRSSSANWDISEVQTGDIVVLNKADLAASGVEPELRRWAIQQSLDVVESCALENDVQELLSVVRSRVVQALSGSEMPAGTRIRHRMLICEAMAHMDRALEASNSAELMAEDVRLAARAMERLAGRIDPEAVLDRVFSAFCIGK